jgi:hypothetical protein
MGHEFTTTIAIGSEYRPGALRGKSTEIPKRRSCRADRE